MKVQTSKIFNPGTRGKDQEDDPFTIPFGRPTWMSQEDNKLLGSMGYNLLINGGILWGERTRLIRSPLILTSVPGHPSRTLYDDLHPGNLAWIPKMMVAFENVSPASKKKESDGYFGGVSVSM